MLNIDNFAYSSGLLQVHPGEKLLFAVVTMLICLLANSITIAVLIILIMAFLTTVKGRVPPLAFLKLLSIPMTFLVIGVITVAITPVDSATSIIWRCGWFGYSIGITTNSLISAGRLFWKSLGSVSCLYFLSLSTPILDIITVLRRLKISPLFLEILSLTYRFIFVLLETADRIMTSQNARLGYSTLKNGFRSLGRLIATLFLGSYLRSQNLYLALEARGYGGELKVLELPYRISKKKIAVIIAAESFLILISFLIGGKF